MSRIYVLQAPMLAVAAARMKTDVNYIGMTDHEATVKCLEENHVFMRDVWNEGSLTEKRLQRLYHRLFPGDFLLMDSALPHELMMKASSYARELGAQVVISLKASEAKIADPIGDAAEILVCEPGAEWSGTPGAAIQLKPEEHLEAWVGALALCLMNGLELERSTAFCRRAAAFAEPPWYDEVAYGSRT